MPMDNALRAQIETYRSHLDSLILRGQQLRDLLAAAPGSTSAMTAVRAWQEDCGITINQLSGGSKSHWLARSFSEAFLMRSAAGPAVEGATPAEIILRLLGVLDQAVSSLSQIDDPRDPTGHLSSFPDAPSPRRFEFVHNPELRPIVERAYSESRRALDEGNYDLALRTSCGVLEAIVTDALQHKGVISFAAADAPAGKAAQKIPVKHKPGEEKIADWSFETRLAVAERDGLIRGGCARLPAVARTYRDHADNGGTEATISERDARVAGQVLHVVMKDLDPGR